MTVVPTANPNAIPQQPPAPAAPATATPPADNAASPATPVKDPNTFKTAIRALAALTGADPEKLGQDFAQKGILALPELKKYANEHQEQLKALGDPKKLAKLTPEQRKDVAEFYRAIGADMTAFDTPASPQETPEQKAEREAKAISNAAQDTGGGLNDPASAFFMALFMMVARAIGGEGFANTMMGLMRSAPGGHGDGSFSGRAMADGNARFGDVAEINTIVEATPGKGTLGGVVNLMKALQGQHEMGDNGGAIVQAVMGSEGLPWCGGIVRFAFDKMGLDGVYSQADYKLAASYMTHAQKYDAFHDAGSVYMPKPGDVIVFSREGGSGHVGIVTGTDQNGNVTYTAGNDGDAVRSHTFNGKLLPGNLRGFADTHTIAAAKGIDIDTQKAEHPAAAQAPAPAPARTVAAR